MSGESFKIGKGYVRSNTNGSHPVILIASIHLVVVVVTVAVAVVVEVDVFFTADVLCCFGRT